MFPEPETCPCVSFHFLQMEQHQIKVTAGPVTFRCICDCDMKPTID